MTGDEEPNSPYNPYQDQNGAWGAAYKGRIIPGKTEKQFLDACIMPSSHDEVQLRNFEALCSSPKKNLTHVNMKYFSTVFLFFYFFLFVFQYILLLRERQ